MPRWQAVKRQGGLGALKRCPFCKFTLSVINANECTGERGVHSARSRKTDAKITTYLISQVSILRFKTLKRLK